METQQTWLHKQLVIDTAVKTGRDVFGGAWKKDSLWTWLDFLSQMMPDVGFSPAKFETDLCYQSAMIQLLPWVEVEAFLGMVTGLATDKSLNPDGFARMELLGAVHLQKLDLLEASLPKKEIWFFSDEHQVDDLVDRYEKLRELFRPFAAALLLYSPPNTDFYLENMSEPVVVFRNATVQNLRLIGQRIAGEDRLLSDTAVAFLRDFSGQSLLQPLRTQNDLVVAGALHSAFQFFWVHAAVDQDFLIKKYLFVALWYRVPVIPAIQGYLADLPTRDEYVTRSGQFASQMRLSTYDDKMLATGPLGDWVKSFEKVHPKDDFVEGVQQEYVEKTIAGKQEAGTSVDFLASFLHCAIELRECSLVDYRGLLSESGAKPAPFDWKDILANDIADVLLNEIQFYFRLVHRPILLRIEIIAAAMQIGSWSSEPVIDRLLLLSDRYSKVYEAPFSPIVFWDEKSFGWQLNTELPLGWANTNMEPYLVLDEKISRPIPPLPK